MLFAYVIQISSDSSSSESNDVASGILPGLLAWYYPEQHSLQQHSTSSKYIFEDSSTDSKEVDPIQAIEPLVELPAQAPVQVQMPVQKAHKKKVTQDIVLGLAAKNNPKGFGAPSSGHGKGKRKMV